MVNIVRHETRENGRNTISLRGSPLWLATAAGNGPGGLAPQQSDERVLQWGKQPYYRPAKG